MGIWLPAVCALLPLVSSFAIASTQASVAKPSEPTSAERKLDFEIGGSLFRRLWVSAPASTQTADGLGPLYETRSCSGCHPDNRKAIGPAHSIGTEAQALPVGLVTRIGLAPSPSPDHVDSAPDPVYGKQLQRAAVPGLDAEARILVSYEELPQRLADGTWVSLRKPTYHIDQLNYGPLDSDTRISVRLAPSLRGLGLLNTVDDQTLRNLADPQDSDGDGISGRVNQIQTDAAESGLAGRFGLKAAMPDLTAQIHSAFSLDLGLAVARHPNPAGDCTEQQAACLRGPHGTSPDYDDLEAHLQITEAVERYLSMLAPPSPRQRDPQAQAGAQLFDQIGCADCHRPKLQTGTSSPHPELRARQFAPYTDLLLHDLGPGLADNLDEGQANGGEWRTAPLWGLGEVTSARTPQHFLHDGRARNLLEAILWHAGEAQTARDRVVELSSTQRQQLLRFLETL